MLSEKALRERISARGHCLSKEHGVGRDRLSQRSERTTGWPWMATVSGTEAVMETGDVC